MYAGKVELCGVDTARLPVLSEAEKARLIKAARAGDRQARQEMVQGNLRLVLSVVQKFASRGENMDDLFQVGCIGLIKAIDNFDPAQNVRFSTYGVPMIVGEVKRYLRDNNAVRVSRSIRDLAYHSMQAREELQKQNGREPKISEIAAKVGQSPENVAMALESAVTPASLYEPVYSDGEDSFALVDQLRDNAGEENWISDMMFRDTVKALTPRERRIIALRYLRGQTQTQVAQEIGISQAQVSRLEKAALKHIKEQICADKAKQNPRQPNRTPRVIYALLNLDPTRSQRTGEGLRVLIQNTGDAQVVRGLGICLVVVHKNRLIVGQATGLHQRCKNLRLGLAQVYVAGRNPAVEQ